MQHDQPDRVSPLIIKFGHRSLKQRCLCLQIQRSHLLKHHDYDPKHWTFLGWLDPWSRHYVAHVVELHKHPPAVCLVLKLHLNGQLNLNLNLGGSSALKLLKSFSSAHPPWADIVLTQARVWQNLVDYSTWVYWRAHALVKSYWPSLQQPVRLVFQLKLGWFCCNHDNF